MMRKENKFRFAIVGCGRVGTSLAKELVKVGYVPAGFASANPNSANQLAAVVGYMEKAATLTWEATINAEIVFITTPDQEIEKVCQEIAAEKGFAREAVVLHCSGALPSTILETAKKNGAAIGSMHPLQSIAGNLGKNPFDRIMMAIEGDQVAVDLARNLAHDLGATPFNISTKGKILYHASAVVASNFLVTLMDLSFQLLSSAGVKSSDLHSVLRPLVNGTLDNIREMGIPSALTGPIARGDVDIVKEHVSAMQCLPPNLLRLYKTLGQLTIDIALQKGTLSESGAGRLRELMEDPSLL